MSNWLGINAEYDPPYKNIEIICGPSGEAYNRAKTDEEIQQTGKAHQRCLQRGYDSYNSELAKQQEYIDLAVLGGNAFVALVILVVIAKQWDRISAKVRQYRIDFEAARAFRAKDKERAKADFARKVQERLNELERQREG